MPERYQRHRRQLQDAMLDTHFMLGTTRVAVAGDGDLVAGFTRLVQAMGGDVTSLVVPTMSPGVQALEKVNPMVGDLEEVEKTARSGAAQILITNSHGVATAERLGIPILRAGFPQYDLLGGFQRCWFGYRGTSQTLFDLANLKLTKHEDVPPYYSVYSQKHDEPVQGCINH